MFVKLKRTWQNVLKSLLIEGSDCFIIRGYLNIVIVKLSSLPIISIL